MVFIPGETFRMGSDHHYPEEAPAHRVRVDGFWIDRAPVTNRQFARFVLATGHKTFARKFPRSEGLPWRLAAHALCRLADSSYIHRRLFDMRDWSASGGPS